MTKWRGHTKRIGLDVAESGGGAKGEGDAQGSGSSSDGANERRCQMMEWRGWADEHRCPMTKWRGLTKGMSLDVAESGGDIEEEGDAQGSGSGGDGVDG